MFRLIRLLIFIGIVSVSVIGAYLWVNRIPTLERFFSKKLGTPVTIQGVQIGWNTLTIEGMGIKNPENSILSMGFESEAISIKMPLYEILKETVHIELIQIKNPILTIELYSGNGSDNNWQHLLNHFPRSGSRLFTIDKLSIENLRFEGMRIDKKPFSIASIPYLEFVNLGNKYPLTVQQIGRIVIQSILSTLTDKAYLGNILDEVLTYPERLIEGTKSTIPLDQMKGKLQEGVETLRRKTQETKKFLQDFFTK